MNNRLVIAALLAALFLLPAAAASAASLPAGTTALLSGGPSLLAPLPAPVGVTSITRFAASEDGRFVAFSSRSDGLLEVDDDYVANVYVKDTVSGSVTLVSRRTGAAGEPSHGDCFLPSISDDGSRVAFVCVSTLDDADTNGYADVYLRDLVSGATVLISRAGGLGAVGNQGSDEPVLSANGEYVAFSSRASNLDPAANGPDQRVYRRRVGAGNETILVSRRTGAGGQAAGGSEPSISDDGNRVAFTHYSVGEVIDPGDTNGPTIQDVYVRDIAAGTTVLASRADGSNGNVGNGRSYAPALAGNGSAVAFESQANQFDFANDPDTTPDVYRRSLTTNATALVSITIGGDKGHNSTRPSIDDSGVVVGFVSQGTTLDAADTQPQADAYLKNTNNGTLQLVSRADGAAGPAANAPAERIALSGNGQAAAVAINRGSILPGTEPRRSAVMLRNVPAGRTLSVARPPGSAPFLNAGGVSFGTALSADGRYAAFVSAAPALGLPLGTDRAVFVRDRVSGQVTLASRADGAAGAPLSVETQAPAISADGRRVAFTAGPSSDREVFVRDLARGRTFLASRANGAAGQPGNGTSDQPSLDADGSRVAFVSYAANLGDGDTDALPDVHVRALDSGRTLLASRADGAAGAKGNGESGLPDLNGDGTRVVFSSRATNLGDGDADSQLDIHLRDLSAGATRLVSATPGGTKSNSDASSASIDRAGTTVAFVAAATNLLGATQPVPKVFVRDLAGRTLALASPAGTASRESSISPDGGYVAFSSDAGTRQAYLRDLAGGRTELVSRGPAGAPASRPAVAEDVSAGGGCVAFATDAALLGPPSDLTQAYLRARRVDCDAGSSRRPRTRGRDTRAPVLSRVRLSRKRFRVAPAATPRSAAARRGTILRFRSTEAGRLSIVFERALPRRRGKVRHRRAGRIERRIRAGAGRVALSGRIGRRALKAGRYRLTLRARDAAGNRSKRVRRQLTIVKR